MSQDRNSDAALAPRIEALAALLGSEDGHLEEQLAAVLPAHVDRTDCAVIVWRTSDSARYELRRIDDATVIDEDAPLRDALTLLAVIETLTEPLAPERLRTAALALQAWRDRARAELPGAVGPAEDDDDADATTARERFAALDRAFVESLDALSQLELRVGDDAVSMASTERLEAVATAQLALDSSWSRLEDAADAFTELIQAGHADIAAALWAGLATGRRGPLAQPAAALVENGRQAGAAFATDVLGARFAG